MKAAEIRSQFLRYFEKNGHTIVESSSLVPDNDPTLLFTNAGMVQFKDVFLGKDQRPYRRATTTQKCVRAGGKHNDLENVGFTARHHTFFEMLGNFSFGDYFKKDAIRFAWEFVTQVLKLPKDRLYVTVFEKDDEAAEIWNRQEGVPKDRIFRFGEKDNFWAMGDTGPCGPCSEIFFDRGEKYSCGKSTCAMGCDCDRYMEFWNLVFMQFNRDASGQLTPLPRPSVDTGAGLERIAAILQDVDSNYDTDLFQEIIVRTSQLRDVKAEKQGVVSAHAVSAHVEDAEKDADLAVSYRVVADHSRATTFLIGDGVLPSNEGRGYVLRRIMRRAIRHGKKLGFQGPFLHRVVGFVMDQMKEAFPDLSEKRTFIERAVLAEEEQFFRTLERGLSLLDEEISKLGRSKTLPGEVAFKLYDTYGFPLDLTRVICSERGLGVDEAGFEKSMDRQRSESRKHWKGSGDEATDSIYLQLVRDLRSKNRLPRFVGYEAYQAEAECLAILVPEEGEATAEALGNGRLQKVDQWSTPPLSVTADSTEKTPIIEVVFAETPFYGESGGQVGDRGRVLSSQSQGLKAPGAQSLKTAEFEGEVIDVQKPVPELIVAHIRPKKGTLKIGSRYLQETDAEIRALTARNHTATHLLHWALREVLGKHVKQAGSLVAPDLLRFDFTHFQPMTEAELLEVENKMNQKIWTAQAVSKTEMEKEEAIAAGAIAFFGEKYGDRVRVVRIGDFSTELCGGTHIDNSSEIHLFKIANESGIAAGIRRIIAYTSKGAFEYLRGKEAEIKAIQDRLKASSSQEILGKIEKILESERNSRKELERVQAKSAGSEVDEMIAGARVLAGTPCVVSSCASDEQGVKRLRDLADRIKQKAPNSVIVLGMKAPGGERAFLLAAKGPKAPKDLNAQELIQKTASLIDGRGGGKPDLAQAGGDRATGLPEALTAALGWLEERLSN